MEKYDYIIIGQGLAGTLLAFFLLQEGQKVLIIDNNETEKRLKNNFSHGASKIAAGLINPITGRRIVKSWRIDEFLPFAKKTYQSIENQYNISIWQDRTIIRTLKNADDENEWLLRSNWEDYRPYCQSEVFPSQRDSDEAVFLHNIKPFYGFGEIIQAAQVNLPFLISFFRKKWLKEGILINQHWQDVLHLDEKDALKIPNGLNNSKKIIFCEGANGIFNPYFNWLPFNIDKGELLLVKIPNLNLSTIFKNNISIVPLGDDVYWVGATNEWNSNDDMPTDEKKQLIVNELHNILTIEFEVIDHKSAMRPTVRDRRPFIGFHPNFPQLAIFNGFGTKGASLIPYWAHHFSEVILRGVSLDKDVDIKRFN